MFHSFKDNSFTEWSFERAITIQTYSAYDPIPVPLNIIYNIGELLYWCLVLRCDTPSLEEEKEVGNNSVILLIFP